MINKMIFKEIIKVSLLNIVKNIYKRKEENLLNNGLLK